MFFNEKDRKIHNLPENVALFDIWKFLHFWSTLESIIQYRVSHNVKTCVEQSLCQLYSGNLCLINSYFACRVSKGGIQNQKGFGLQIIIPRGNYCISWTNVAASCQKVQKSDFQSQYSKSKTFSLKNVNFSALFLLLTIFDNFNC